MRETSSGQIEHNRIDACWQRLGRQAAIYGRSNEQGSPRCPGVRRDRRDLVGVQARRDHGYKNRRMAGPEGDLLTSLLGSGRLPRGTGEQGNDCQPLRVAVIGRPRRAWKPLP